MITEALISWLVIVITWYMHVPSQPNKASKENTTISCFYDKNNTWFFQWHIMHSQPFETSHDITTRKVLIDNVPKSSAKGYFSSPMGLTRRYGFCCRNCARQSLTTIFSVRRAWAPLRHGKSDRCRSVSGSPLTADVMQTDTWQTPLTGS